MISGSSLMHELYDLLEKIKENSQIIIVEGKKDKKALLDLDISSKQILALDKPLFAVVEEAVQRVEEGSSSSIVILTDMDQQGKKLYATLSRDLQRHGLSIDNALRHFLLKNTPLRHIEGLTSYTETLNPNFFK